MWTGDSNGSVIAKEAPQRRGGIVQAYRGSSEPQPVRISKPIEAKGEKGEREEGGEQLLLVENGLNTSVSIIIQEAAKRNPATRRMWRRRSYNHVGDSYNGSYPVCL